ncbi:hypothetical protein [Sphingobium sp.]|uniref:hypothetical protein n=1 Tax=Sphingobium sp. TaxID=1912891 RepID=UPI002E22D46C
MANSILRPLLRWLLHRYPWRGGLLTVPFDAEPIGRRFLYIPSDDELLDRQAVRRMARELGDLRLSRRKLMDWVADQVYGFDGEFYAPGGAKVRLPEVDETFGEPSFKWVGDFLKWRDREPAQAIQQKVLPRLRMFAMALEAMKSRPKG